MIKYDTDVKDNATNQQKNNYMISQSPQRLNEKVQIWGSIKQLILNPPVCRIGASLIQIDTSIYLRKVRNYVDC